MKKSSLFLALALGLAACSNPEGAADSRNEKLSEQAPASEQLKKEVMALHDKVMPEMTPMSKLQGQLKIAAQSHSDSIELLAAAEELQKSKDAMMEWMRDFSANFDDEMSEAEKVGYLMEQKARMQSIDLRTQAALHKGKTILPQEQE